MVPSPFLRVALGLTLLVLGGLGAEPPSASAQDRSVPRFGPLVAPDTVNAGEYDLGRVWSFADPPLEYLSDTYDVPADTQGLGRLRRRTFRLPGCSGTLVSSDGLLLTAARCVRSRLSPTAADSLRTDAVWARRPAQEPAIDSLYAERVVGVEDVTARVEAQVEGEASSGDARRAAARAVQEALSGDTPAPRRVEVVPEAGGRRYVAYTYHRYDDVRLVFLPERAVTLFGASDQLLSYPQHAWDVSALRVYDDGSPLQTPDHFDVRRTNVRPGDAVFAVAHPPDGPRVESAEQGAFRRDVALPADLAALRSWTTHARAYADTAATPAPTWIDRRRRARIVRKRRRAQLDALKNDYFQGRLEARDARFRRRAAGGEEDGGALLDRLADLQTEKRALADPYRGFSFLLHPQHSSATLRRAFIAYHARQTGDADAADAMRAVPDQPRALDAARLEDHQRRLRTHLGDDSTIERALEQVGRPEGIVRGSVFSEKDASVSALEAAALPDEDPALRIVSALYEQYASFEEAWTRLRTREAGLTDSLARVRHQAADTEPALPQSRAPRFADGRARGYEYNGTVAASFTTFYGLYGHHHAGASEEASGLPSRWASPSGELDRSVPLTRVATTDVQGDYGGPLVDESLQLVGIQTDGNVQSAAGAFLFLPRRMRTVAVDVRGVLEALSAVYGAEALVEEIEAGTAPDE